MNEQASEPYGNLRVCLLIITHKCNLNCSYCYQSRSSSASDMRLDKAKKIVLKEISLVKDSEDFKNLRVDFIGGEPLLRFDFIRTLAEWIWNELDEDVSIYATTNGTLLNETMREWFTKNKSRVRMSLSLDGDYTTQNTNRSNSFESLDIDFFVELGLTANLI